ncbi:MAG: hypothetical protein IH596_13475 [Bacteroidales bacterium]|nr:hypothetical protein [Bacteroidales bacterium]
MSSRFCHLLLTCLLLLSGQLFSQDAARDLDQVYGLDQTLYNGKKYTYFILYSTTGHQYLLSPQYSYGSVTIKGTRYDHVFLNYDIFNQQLLLKYLDKTGAAITIELSKAWLEGFTMSDKNFELLHLEQEPCFYQVLGKGPLQILYHWRKSLDLETVVGSANYIFKSPVRDSFVLKDGQLLRFSSKRSFIKLFDPEQKLAIKSYMRKNKIKIRKSSDLAMAAMIDYIANIR